MSNPIKHCEILIIAAGQSKRLGQPKQLLHYEGKSLINRLVDVVKSAGSFPITIVLGAEAHKVKAQLIEKDLNIVINEGWEEGMGSSIRVGLYDMMHNTQHQQSHYEMDGVMILVCDQPFITKESIQSLLKLQQETTLPMAACYYAGVLGTPALFRKDIFPDLLKLSGDMGAKKIINNNVLEVAKLHFEKGVLDIDTIEDYKQLLNQQDIL